MSNNRRRGPMGGPGRGMAPGEKAKDLKGTMVKLIKYMRRFYVPIVMVIIFAIASTVFNIVGPTILGDATTEIFKGLVRKVSGGSGIDFDKVKHILLMLSMKNLRELVTKNFTYHVNWQKEESFLLSI